MRRTQLLTLALLAACTTDRTPILSAAADSGYQESDSQLPPVEIDAGWLEPDANDKEDSNVSGLPDADLQDSAIEEDSGVDSGHQETDAGDSGSPGEDAGTADASSTGEDSGTPDSGHSLEDASTADSGTDPVRDAEAPVDAGPPDADYTDAGPGDDASTKDAGTGGVDSSIPDAGTDASTNTDAGGPVDAGQTDSGPPPVLCAPDQYESNNSWLQAKALQAFDRGTFSSVYATLAGADDDWFTWRVTDTTGGSMLVEVYYSFMPADANFDLVGAYVCDTGVAAVTCLAGTQDTLTLSGKTTTTCRGEMTRLGRETRIRMNVQCPGSTNNGRVLGVPYVVQHGATYCAYQLTAEVH